MSRSWGPAAIDLRHGVVSESVRVVGLEVSEFCFSPGHTIKEPKYVSTGYTQSELAQALMEFVEWRCAQKRQPTTVLVYDSENRVFLESLPWSSIFHPSRRIQDTNKTNYRRGRNPINRELEGIERAHVQAGTPRNGARAIVPGGRTERSTTGNILMGQGGRILWLCL